MVAFRQILDYDNVSYVELAFTNNKYVPFEEIEAQIPDTSIYANLRIFYHKENV